MKPAITDIQEFLAQFNKHKTMTISLASLADFSKVPEEKGFKSAEKELDNEAFEKLKENFFPTDPTKESVFDSMTPGLASICRQRVTPKFLDDLKERSASRPKEDFVNTPHYKKIRREIVEELAETLRKAGFNVVMDPITDPTETGETPDHHDKLEPNAIGNASEKENLGFVEKAGAPHAKSEKAEVVDDNAKEGDAPSKAEKKDELKNVEDNGPDNPNESWIVITKEPGCP